MCPRSARPLELTAPALIGLLVAASGAARLPARSWALAIALDVIESAAPTNSTLSRAASRVPRSSAAVASPRALDLTVLGLAREGHLVPTGTGWDAGFDPSQAWVARHGALAGALTPGDQAVLRQAAQRLKAALSTWSKKSVASGPVGSVVI
jgi:hypothetical protein